MERLTTSQTPGQSAMPFLQYVLIEIDEHQGAVQRQINEIMQHLKTKPAISRRLIVRKLQKMCHELNAINDTVWNKAMLDLRLQQDIIDSHSQALIAYSAEEITKWHTSSWMMKRLKSWTPIKVLSNVVKAWDTCRAKLHCTIAPPECWVDQKPAL